jgi:hypothetical protein
MSKNAWTRLLTFGLHRPARRLDLSGSAPLTASPIGVSLATIVEEHRGGADRVGLGQGGGGDALAQEPLHHGVVGQAPGAPPTQFRSCSRSEASATLRMRRCSWSMCWLMASSTSVRM